VKLSELGEDKLIHRLTRHLDAASNVVVGIGDDCAAVQQPGRNDLLLLETDCLIENIHFLRSAQPARVGWKALCRNISDIAAMGGRPEYALITAALPSDLELSYAEGIYRGIQKAARKYGVTIVGGETSSSTSGIFLSIALTGTVEPDRIRKRSTAHVGDALYVTGKLGGSLGGRHLRFEPRLAEGRWLAAQKAVTAMMDLSDGLGSDLPRLASASGTSFDVDKNLLPRHRGASPKQAWADGEDYELLIAVSSKTETKLTTAWKRQFPNLPLTRIGRLTPKTPHPQAPQGFDHFRK